MIIYGDDEEKQSDDIKLLASNATSLTHKRLQDTSLRLFQNLVTRVLLPPKPKDEDQSDHTNENKQDDVKDVNQRKGAAMTHQLVRLMSSDEGELSDLQKMVFQLTISEILKQLEKSEKLEQAFYDMEEESESLNMSIEEERLHQMRLNEIAINDKYVYEMLWTVLQMVESGGKSAMFLAFEKRAFDNNETSKTSKRLITALIELLPRSTSRMQNLLFTIYSKVFVHYNDPTMIDDEIIYVSTRDPQTITKSNKHLKARKFIFDDVSDYLLYCLASSMNAQYRGIDKNSKKDLKVEGWIPAFENDQAIKCVNFIKKQMNDNIGFKQHIGAKLIEYIIICKKLTPQYFTNTFKSDTDWKSTNLTYLDYFWLICSALCIVSSDDPSSSDSIAKEIELDIELNKTENNDIQIEY